MTKRPIFHSLCVECGKSGVVLLHESCLLYTSIGRDREIYRTIQILSRRQKNNPCLIGEAGVGTVSYTHLCEVRWN